jgi:spermidine synthase
VFAAEYPGVLHLLTLWSESGLISQRRRKTANREQRMWATAPRINPCSYFDPRFLAYYLYLPRCVRERLDPDLLT